ncbi:type 1 glutamine amidotransferase family protein [Streptomyces liangshanensis]|uniref:hypothetical protein n=1 Tax=Streptomyces liangshanensis TaxID=2717324 RepID=UPI0036DC9F76
MCNGSLLLGTAGLLRGYESASYWYTRDLLKNYGAVPKPDRVVIDRNRVSGGGVTAGVDFGLTLLGVLQGEEFGKFAELSFEYAPEPPFGTGRPELADAATLQRTTAVLEKSCLCILRRSSRTSDREPVRGQKSSLAQKRDSLDPCGRTGPSARMGQVVP